MIHADGGVVKVAADGSLTIQAPGGTLHETAPVSWDVLPDGTQRPLESHFRVDGQGDYGFEVVGHDPTLPLVIDPILVPAPTIVGPANGASVTEPFNISWTSVTSNPSGVIAYNWQVSTSSTFTHDRRPGLGQQPDHPGRHQRPGERHLFLARPGGRRRARSGGVVGDAELHDHGRQRQRAGHARARAAPGLHHVPPVRDRDHLVDPRPGRRDVRLRDLARRPELRVEQHVPGGQHRQDDVDLRHRLRGDLLLARLRRQRRRDPQPAVERDLVHLLLQQPHRAAAGAAVPHQRADGDAAGHAPVGSTCPTRRPSATTSRSPRTRRSRTSRTPRSRRASRS